MRLVALICAWLGGSLAAGAGLLALYVAVVWARLPEPAELPATGDPGATAFMAEDRCDAHARQWRALDDIDPRLVCTVVWSEDWLFFDHDGIDRAALRGALERNWRERSWSLGGSTITMQLARNLYLSRARTPSRKGKELALAVELERRADKRRLLELYLNAAEWAPCTYGVEAAARHYLGHGAERIDLAEAAFLASMLPRPAVPPGQGVGDRPALVRKQQHLLRRVARSGLVAKSEFLAAQRAILDYWASGWDRAIPVPAPARWGAAIERTCGTEAFLQNDEKGIEF